MLRAIRLDATTLLLWGGAAALVVALRSPYDAAQALAAAERQALAAVRALAAGEDALAALAAPPDPDAQARYLGAVHERCRAAGLPPAAWPRHVDDAPRDGLVLGAGGWLFLVARTPAPASEVSASAAPPAVEAWAWPRHEEAPFRTVFCTRGAQTWSTRNLTRRYLGTGGGPQPGSWRPRKAELTEPQYEYWAIDGQYWRLVPP